MWIAAWSPARSKLRRMVLPSIATSRPWGRSATAAVQLTKHCSNSTGSSLANTRPNVSWLGMPLGNARNVFSQSCLHRPKYATSLQFSAPQITARIAMATMSSTR